MKLRSSSQSPSNLSSSPSSFGSKAKRSLFPGSSEDQSSPAGHKKNRKSSSSTITASTNASSIGDLSEEIREEDMERSTSKRQGSLLELQGKIGVL